MELRLTIFNHIGCHSIIFHNTLRHIKTFDTSFYYIFLQLITFDNI